MNKASSRSHAVFQIKIAKRKRVLEAATAGQKFECTLARLNVVDLAGSERVKKSGVEGMQFKEATNINKSLLAFGNVVSALAAKKAHIPLRDSKLTRILDGSIGGNCRTALLVCASPASENVHETLSTFEFASRAMRVEVDAKVNTAIVEFSAKALLADLSSDVGDLGGLKLGPELEALRKSAKEAAEKARKHAHEGEKAIQEAQSQAKKLQAEAEAAEMRGRQWQDQLASLRQGQELASSEADELRQAVKLASAEASEATAMLSEATAKAAAKAKEAAEATAKAEKFRAAAEKAENEALEWKAAALAREAEVKQVRVVQAKRDTAEIIKKKEEVVQAKQEASQKITEFKKEASEATVKAEARAELAEKAAASQGERASAAEAAMEAEREEAQKKLLAAEQLSEEALRVAAAEADSLRAQKEQAAAQSTAFEAELQSRTEELREKTKLLDEARIALEHLRREADDRETRLRLQFLAEIKELQQKHLAEVQALHFQITEAKSECERIQKESQSSMEEERQRHTAQAEALETMMRQKAGLAASDAAQLAAQHVAAAAQFAADFEARLSAGRESFEARLSELERSAQEQRRELLQELDEAKAEVTRTDERWKEVKEEAVREALEGGNAQQRRLSAAFKAARCIGSMKESELSKAVDELAERFAARESRPEDVQSLTLQQKKLQEQQKYLLEKEREKQHLSLELENRDANDRIFGGAERRRSKCPAGMGVPVLGKKLGEEQRYADRADKRRTSMERSSTPKSNSGRGLFTRSDAFVSVR
ncbi:unnamed protein product [Polarella glacialis]|uniref:Kinesin-like protein n=1 Tax=Polarella glacialis TaxID=89957 RepID=A0A813FMB8_POLGL|nr:unnamed protein product [Polarella glacialis]